MLTQLEQETIMKLARTMSGIRQSMAKRRAREEISQRAYIQGLKAAEGKLKDFLKEVG